MSNYDDALTAAIAYQTQIAHVKLILRPAIEAARERCQDFCGNCIDGTYYPTFGENTSGKSDYKCDLCGDIYKEGPMNISDYALLEAGKILGVE